MTHKKPVQKTSKSLTDLRRRVRRLRAVIDAAALVNSTLDLQLIANHVVSIATRLLSAERGSLFLLDREKAALTPLVAHGVEGGQLHVHVGEGIVGTVARTGRPIILSDPYSDRRFNPRFDRETGFKTRSLLTVPVRDRGGELVAVLQLLNHRGHPFNKDDAAFLGELGVPFAIALCTAQMHKQVVERERMMEELRLAAEIQRTMQPMDLAHVSGLDIHALFRPCLEVGGDYFDLIPTDRGTWWLVVGDVSGKGVSAALVASNLQAFLWSRKNDPAPLSAIMAVANDLLRTLARGR
jgi:sigma-B regulation protein RsbU (phosphoserine phosphatase)